MGEEIALGLWTAFRFLLLAGFGRILYLFGAQLSKDSPKLRATMNAAFCALVLGSLASAPYADRIDGDRMFDSGEVSETREKPHPLRMGLGFGLFSFACMGLAIKKYPLN